MAGARVKVGLDSSCLVPLLMTEHGFHEPTRAEWDKLKREQAQFVVPCHALLETFSVLTRIPAPYRRVAEAVREMLHENFAQDAIIPGVDAELVWTCLEDLVARHESGGVIYDAVIAHSTFSAGASVLLTWNVRDFVRIAPAGLEIMTPGEYAARASRLH